MRSRWRSWAPAGLLAIVGLLDLGAAPARAQFPVFSGGDVLLPDGRKLGTPPVGPGGHAAVPSRPKKVAPQPRVYAAPRYYAPVQRATASGYRFPPQAHYAPQSRPY